ncbi:MAG: DUF962 domain-containing protein [Bdellovibrionales bacterium]|nr:DUF962 domain-containing protein [Bdellovibrionales bacterium]
MQGRFRDFKLFYPFYLREHRRPLNRVLHFGGTSLFLCFALGGIASGAVQWVGLGVVCVYGLAWFGHFFIERNRPATFKHPWFSLLADFKLYGEIWLGRRSLFRSDA